jgi:hypothetical protein
MIILGLIAPIAAFFFVDSVAGDLLGGSSDFAFLIAVIAAVCSGWWIVQNVLANRHNFLHPEPREYRATSKQVFVKLRETLNELSYNFGDRWHIVVADTQANRIVADLRFTDEESDFDQRTQRVQRFLRFEANIKDTSFGCALLQLDFNPRVEGMSFWASDRIITEMMAAIDMQLGAWSVADVR